MRPPPSLTVGKLTIRLAGRPAAEGEILAQLVVRGLAEGETMSGGARPSRMHVTVAATPDTQTDDLADRIVASILRELQRNG